MASKLNGQSFLAYVKQIAAPTFKRRDIVVMDKVSVHKVAGVREAINARGLVLLYLPPDSPDLNPIEQFFSKSKRCCASGSALNRGLVVGRRLLPRGILAARMCGLLGQCRIWSTLS